jgi:hypothetical protein
MIALSLYYLHKVRGLTLGEAAFYALPLGLIGDITIAILLARAIHG